MKITLEVHKFAPELNAALLGPTKTRVSAPGCTTIRQVRERLFRRLPMKGRHVTMASNYPESHASLNRMHSGFCNNVHQLGNAIKDLRKRLAPNLGATVNVKSKLIG